MPSTVRFCKYHHIESFRKLISKQAGKFDELTV